MGIKGLRGVTVQLLDFALVFHYDISDIVVHSPFVMMVVFGCVWRDNKQYSVSVDAGGSSSLHNIMNAAARMMQPQRCAAT